MDALLFALFMVDYIESHINPWFSCSLDLRTIEIWLHNNGIRCITIRHDDCNNSSYQTFRPFGAGGIIALRRYLFPGRAKPILYELAHEIRHAWQGEHNIDIMHNTRHYGELMMDLDAYEKHPAEIDANNWAKEVIACYEALCRERGLDPERLYFLH